MSGRILLAISLILLLAAPVLADEEKGYLIWDSVPLSQSAYYETDIKPDITTYELSKILMLILQVQMINNSPVLRAQTDWDLKIMELGTAARHFKRYPTQ